MKKHNIRNCLILLFTFCNFFCTPNAGEKPKELLVASYNVHYFEKGYKGIESTIRKIKPDIIALQEVLVKDGIDYSRKLANGLKYYQASSSHYVNYGSHQWVLSFLSRYPIKGVSQARLGDNRRVFKVKIKVDGVVVTFATLHLAPFVWSKDNIFQANMKRANLRKREIRFLIDWIGKPNMPSVLLGDFNSLPFMGELNPLFELGYNDIYREMPDKKREGTLKVRKFITRTVTKYFPGFPDNGEITVDYILVAGGIKAKSAKVVKSKYSDHYPLIARISLPVSKLK